MTSHISLHGLLLRCLQSRYSIASCPIGANYFLLFRLFRKVELISQSSRLKRAMRNDSSKRRWFFRFCAATISQVLRAGSGDAGKWWWWASLWYSRHSLEYKGLPWLRTREVKEVWSLTDSELKKHGAGAFRLFGFFYSVYLWYRSVCTERKKYAGFWVYPWPSLYEVCYTNASSLALSSVHIYTLMWMSMCVLHVFRSMQFQVMDIRIALIPLVAHSWYWYFEQSWIILFAHKLISILVGTDTSMAGWLLVAMYSFMLLPPLLVLSPNLLQTAFDSSVTQTELSDAAAGCDCYQPSDLHNTHTYLPLHVV